MSDLSIETTPIPGLLVVRLPLHEDGRGWFKENWQREKMTALGLPDFGPVQHNVSFNARRGVTRGIHTEPWDKFVSVAHGRIFGAWVDMREGDTFGAVFTIEVDPTVAVFVPRGVGNSYQALEDATTYTYLVNDHWRPGLAYPALNLADPTVAIPWPIPLAEAEITDKDQATPMLADVEPMAPKKTLIVGAWASSGARASPPTSPAPTWSTSTSSTSPTPSRSRPGPGTTTASSSTPPPTPPSTPPRPPRGAGRAWAANAAAPATLARLAAEHGFTLVHYSTEYVFDGTVEPHTEDEPLSPLGVYAQTKAAGDIAVAAAPRHYVLRTSWVIGDGKNFVRTMQPLAANGVSPTVVDDQVGRLTFTERAVPRDPAPARPAGRRTAPTTSATAARRRRGPTSPRGLRAVRPLGATTSRRSRPRSTSRARTSRRGRCAA